MGFDVAVGMSGDQLTAASQAVYTKLYPNVFTGTQTQSYQGISYTVKWDVQQAPVFILSIPGDREALIDALRVPPEGTPPNAAPELAEAARGLAAQTPSFTLSLPAVAITLSNGVTTTLTLPFVASCSINVSGNAISFTPYAVATQQQSDPVQNYLVQNIVVPAVSSLLTSVLSGITIPPIEIAGTPLSTPAVAVAGNAFVAVANLAQSGTPPPPDSSFPWPSAPFFALLGPNVVQALTANLMQSATNRFSDGGSGGDWWAGYYWKYGLSLVNPATAIQGTSIVMSFSLGGGIGAGVNVLGADIGLGFNASAAPNPSLTAGTAIQNDSLVISTQSVNAFAIIVTPSGGIPGWVLGWLVAAIITGVVSSVTPLITRFLGGINLTSYALPSYGISVAGVSLSFTPSNPQLGNVAGYLAITGTISVGG